MGLLVDLTNKRFGKLLVIRRNGTRSGEACWDCLCSCGNTKNIIGGSLRDNKTKSCGCLQKELLSLPKGERVFNAIFDKYKRDSKKRGIEFSLSKENFRKLITKNCFHCGEKPGQSGAKRAGILKLGYNGDFLYNGIDRIDNSVGYILKNCATCCCECNMRKRDSSLEDFDLWLKRTYEFKFNRNI